MKRAFTLIELLVVMMIIGLLCGLLFGGLTKASTWGKVKRTQAELAHLETAIESFHAYKNCYPPCNTNSPELNGLFYELSGTMYSPPDKYEVLKGTETIHQFQLVKNLGISCLVNASAEPREVREIAPIIRNKEALPIEGTKVMLMVSLIAGPKYSAAPGLNPWCYLAPGLNNQETYDLWLDVKVGDKVYRICNWQRDPIVLP